jgi:TolB-like protein/Tfp pilus assembly protein PilF/predicted Ser/Thr protein kinase
MSLSPGEQLGRYEILSPIGAGGMGEVWKARDTRLDRIVAIKQLKAQHNSRFEQEARAIAALNHPNICQIYDIGPDYLVLEYIEGKPLAGPLPLAEALRIAEQIVDALNLAHRRRLIHRDLKPANILLTDTGCAKLLDFGLARLLSGAEATQTAEGTVAGTAAYMSPEQAEGKLLDERTDIFSFGAVLYELISGTRAFAGNSMAQVLSSLLRDDPPVLQTTPALQTIVRKCLAKRPGDRFESVADLKAALEQAKAPGAQRQPSIAVLPFVNMSGDKEQDYFSDGLTEEIINALAQIPELKVTARTSAFSFKGKDVRVAQIATELGVEHILEGSVRKGGNRVRITAQLISASDGFHLWSDRYDRELTDVFAVQDEISASIAAALQAKLVTGPGGRRIHTPKIAAYESYLKAIHYKWKHTSPENLEKSRECYEQAAMLDPQFALPHAGLAEYYHIRASFLMDPREGAALGRRAAQRALELDPSLPEAHAWLGIFAVWADFDWKEAQRRFDLALSRQPISPYLRQLYGYFYLRKVGRAAESVEHIRRALEEDPLNLIMRVGLAASLSAAGKDEEALTEARRILDLDPGFVPAYTLQAMDVTRAPAAEALAFAEKGYALATWNPISAALLAGLLLRNGDRTRAAELVKGLGDGRANAAPVAFAIFHLLCGEVEKAAEWTEKAVEQRHNMVAMLLLTPPWKPLLRTSARWPELARMMNLPVLES